MAEVFLPRQPHIGIGVTRDLETTNATPMSAAITSIPEPHRNSHFVFPPPSDMPALGESHKRTASTMNAGGPRRTSNRSRPSQLSINALPAFDFGAGSSTQTAMSSPTKSPVGRTSPLTHGSGHRRGGSEFIGGDASHGGPMLVGTSPTTPEAKNPPLSLSGQKRGHAHRRSGAVSQTDIAMIMGRPQDDKAGSGSLPTTPSDPAFHRPQIHEVDRSISQPISAGNQFSVRPLVTQENTEVEDVPRSRVGFSEVLEYIPRPLSTISSDTSSSVSTLRPNHSFTDSITSSVSGSTASPPSLRHPRPSYGTLDPSSVRPRAGTYSSVSSSNFEDKENHGPASSVPPNRPSSAPVGEASFTQETSPFLSPSVSLGPLSSDLALSAWTEGSQPRLLSKTSTRTGRPRTSPEPKVTKPQRKVRSWTGLLRKGKQIPDNPAPINHNRPFITQFPATRDGEFSLDDVTFDEDTTCIIETGNPTKLPPSSPQTKPHPRVFHESYEPENERIDPMIDIDAALGTLDPLSDEAAAGFPPSVKRRKHSSGETGGFSGPGMHYHRRTESAPEMETFDRSRFGLPRLGSNPAMTEAIEEEEEDGIHAIEHDEEDEASGLGVNIVEADQYKESPVKRRPRREPCVDQNPQRRIPSPGQDEYFQAVEIVGADEEPRFSVITKSSDESTITPTLSHDPLAPRPASAPIDFAMQTPSLIYSTPETASALSSADYSKTSFDVPDIPRGHTASSSITDRVTMSSSRTGDPGLSSVDDVPSLTSSASTMPTRFSSSSNSNTAADRSYSLSAAIPSRTRPDAASKRSSLASLSRLVGSSYNKSKLNIAEAAPPDSPQKSENKKRHRLSRMMKFWKSKEKLSST